MRIGKTIAISLALALCACTSVGSKTRMISSNTAIITAGGNAFASGGDVTQAAFKEAAETTVNRGYRYFVVVDSSDTSERGSYVLPGSAQTTGTVSASGAYSATTTYTPSQNIDFVKPGQKMVIAMFREGEVDVKTPNLWDAKDVLSTLAAERK